MRELLIKLLTPQPQQQKPKLTPEEIEVRIWGFVVVAITIILFGIVFALLYSVTFVTQPIKSMAPIDQAYTKMLNDIVLLIVGGIGGVMAKKGVQSAAERFAGKQDNDTIIVTQNPTQTNTNAAKSGMPDFN